MNQEANMYTNIINCIGKSKELSLFIYCIDTILHKSNVFTSQISKLRCLDFNQ